MWEPRNVQKGPRCLSGRHEIESELVLGGLSSPWNWHDGREGRQEEDLRDPRQVTMLTAAPSLFHHSSLRCVEVRALH